MKYLIFILSFLFVHGVSARVIPVNDSSKVPAGYTLDAPSGLYTSASNPNTQYRIQSAAGTAVGGLGGEGGSGPDTTDSSNIYNDEITNRQLRDGNVDMNTIPLAIAAIIKFVLGVAGTLSIVALIYHAVQMQLSSGITGDSAGVDKAKKGIYGALIGFVVTILAWFIVMRVVQILTSNT